MGSAVQRRVWTVLAGNQALYPNIFAFLVGPPGTGKTQALNPAMEHLRKSNTVKLAPNDVTKQSLLDTLEKVGGNAVVFETGPMEYHYMAIGVRELSNFMNQYDAALAGLLTDLFDCPPINHEAKRGSGKNTAIIRPGISLLAGTATKNLGATIGKDLWGQGFMSRVILVYSAETPPVNFFADEEEGKVEINEDLVQQLAEIGSLKGRVYWDKPAQTAFKDWYASGMAPKPSHAKLVEYNARRFLHVAKLSTIAALSEVRMTITEADFHKARGWLEATERDMPEIFKEMVVHSDGEVAREMHMHAFALWSMNKKPVHYSQLASFLMTKVATRDIKRIIENAEEAGMMIRIAGTQGVNAQYKPALDGQQRDLPE